MNAKVSVFVICIEAIILLYNLHECTFILFLDVANEGFIKHFGYDEMKFVEDNLNFNLKLIYRIICNCFVTERNYKQLQFRQSGVADSQIYRNSIRRNVYC